LQYHNFSGGEIMISVIIRSKNEEEWIRQCLYAVSKQDFVDFEIILVDNESTDKTLEIAKEFNCKIIKISNKEFSYGRALNQGIQASKGEYLAFLSAHCIPKNTNWLFRLLTNFEDPKVAGVYGRQEPMAHSDPRDKRDLWNTFGLERKEQTTDPFFHNANAKIRRSVWKKIPFDEKISGVEDRLWAKKVLEQGYKIIYEPSASVYHPHGINQAGDVKRCDRVVRVIEDHKLHK